MEQGTFVQSVLVVASSFLLLKWWQWNVEMGDTSSNKQAPVTTETAISFKMMQSDPPTLPRKIPPRVGLVPSHRIVQIFPNLSYTEASGLLEQAGVSNPHKGHYHLTPDTEEAIQRVIDYLVQLYYPDETPDLQLEEANMTCTICYSEDLLFEQMVSCRDNGHLFCTECVRRYAEERLFGEGQLGAVAKNHGDEEDEVVTELMCMADKCSSSFPHSYLEWALPPKVLERYGELQGSMNLAHAKLKGLCACPKCGLRAIMFDKEKEFRCVECQFTSCRHCRGPSHGSSNCPKMDQKEARRRDAEEAMTEALVRRCRCGRPIVKDGGCNLLTCTGCRSYLCNVCKSYVNGYPHFCQAFSCDHTTCNKCPLFKSTDEDDKRAVEEARQRVEAENIDKRSDTTRTAKPLPTDVGGAPANRRQARGLLRRLGIRGR